jgi:hypothetical protein
MKHHYRILQKTWLILPMVAILGVLLYFQHLIQFYSKGMSEQIFEDKKLTVEHLVSELNTLRIAYPEVKDDVYIDFLIKMVEAIDREPGVYARVSDPNCKVISTARYGEREQYITRILFPENPDYPKIVGAMRAKSEGEMDVHSEDNQVLRLFWSSFPKGDPQYYVEIGVIPNVMNELISTTRFTYGLVGMIVIMIIAVYSNVYLMQKHRIGIYAHHDENT